MNAAPKFCRHCHAEPANRPRGLGSRCYQKPAVRELYPVGTRLGVCQDNRALLPEPPPTDARPGSEDKILALIDRAANGLSLWSGGDGVGDE